MASGFAVLGQLARAAPPSMRFLFVESRVRRGLPSHPASRRSSCLWLVVGAINLHRGLTPPSCWSCRAYQRDGPPPGGPSSLRSLLEQTLPERVANELGAA